MIRPKPRLRTSEPQKSVGDVSPSQIFHSDSPKHALIDLFSFGTDPATNEYMKRVLLLILTSSFISCVPTPENETQEAYVSTYFNSYENDRVWRRNELEVSLWRPELPYAQKRLVAYALEDQGWDLLPPLNTDVSPVPNIEKRTLPLTPPTTEEEWIRLGERVFWEMPMRRDPYLEWLVDQPELWERAGLEKTADGNLRGVAQFTDARGNVRTGATCGFCHGENGEAGRASRQLDLGLGRDLFNANRGVESDYKSWGMGRVDVTDDGVPDALRIPDLFTIAKRNHINSSASIKVNSLATLAIRFETQYIVGHSMEARPNRVHTWALAAFIFSLTDMKKNDSVAIPAVFEKKCASCHPVESNFGGVLVPFESLTTDSKSANSVKRGTGFYRAPFLRNTSENAPYMHDGSFDSLEDLLEKGHVNDENLTQEEQQNLLNFLKRI